MKASRVVVSKKWKEPSIELSVSDKGLNISMSLEEFLDSLVEEIGNPALLFSKQKLYERVRAGATAITDEMKRKSVHVV